MYSTVNTYVEREYRRLTYNLFLDIFTIQQEMKRLKLAEQNLTKATFVISALLQKGLEEGVSGCKRPRNVKFSKNVYF
jgi:hypothetical protein